MAVVFNKEMTKMWTTQQFCIFFRSLFISKTFNLPGKFYPQQLNGFCQKKNLENLCLQIKFLCGPTSTTYYP